MSSRDPLLPPNLHQLHRPPLSRLKAHSRAGRNIEALAVRQLAVEQERGVRLEEVVVRPDLDRTVAEVLYLDQHAFAIGRQADLLLAADEGAGELLGLELGGDGELVFAGDREEAAVEREVEVDAVGADGVVDRHEEGAAVSAQVRQQPSSGRQTAAALSSAHPS